MSASSSYCSVFTRTKDLLKEYIEEPSISLRNHVALAMMPYINYRCRYEAIKLDLWDWQDWAHDCYLELLRAIELCKSALNPIGYIIKVIKFYAVKRANKAFKSRSLRWSGNLAECSDYLTIKLGLFYQLHPGESKLGELDKIILNEILKLSDVYRETVYLIAVRGLSQTEVASHLNLNRSTVESRFSTAKQKLRASLRSIDSFRNYEALPDLRGSAIKLKLQGLENRIIAQRLGMDSKILPSFFYRHCR